MLQRWIEENKRFLGGVLGALLILLIFNWFFVWGNRNKHQLLHKKVTGQTTKLGKIYRPKLKQGDPKPPQPLTRTLKKVKQQRDEFSEKLKNEIALYGSAPTGEFLLPGDQGGAKAFNYYFSRRAVVIDELEQAAAANAVNVEDAEFGLPSDAQPGAKPDDTVRKLLWQAQLVRRAVGAAIAAGVDTIEDVQLSGGLSERGYTDGGYRVFGIPLRMEVTGSAAACVRWLESLQDPSQGYVVIVASEMKRDGEILGNVAMQVYLMGMQHTTVVEEE